MAVGITIAIPARNEHRTINQTMNSILTDENINYFGDNLEVIVCLNGCTDNGKTEKAILERSPNPVKVEIKTSSPGKPNAWNEMFFSAKYDAIAFFDADIIAGKQSLIFLYEELEKSGMIAVTATPISIPRGIAGKLLASKFPRYNFSPKSITGAGYIVNKPLLQEEMIKKNYHEMPPDIVNEDRFITLILENKITGEKKWTYSEKAKIFFQDANLIDLYKQAYRITIGEEQLKHDHQEIFSEYDCKTKKDLISYTSRLKIMTTKEKIFKIVNSALYALPRKIITETAISIAKNDYINVTPELVWKEPSSSKKTVPYKTFLKYSSII